MSRLGVYIQYDDIEERIDLKAEKKKSRNVIIIKDLGLSSVNSTKLG